MIWQRLKNLWAWSAWHPSKPPEELGFSWTGTMQSVNQSPSVKMYEPFKGQVRVIPYKPHDPVAEIINQTNAD